MQSKQIDYSGQIEQLTKSITQLENSIASLSSRVENLENQPKNSSTSLVMCPSSAFFSSDLLQSSTSPLLTTICKINEKFELEFTFEAVEDFQVGAAPNKYTRYKKIALLYDSNELILESDISALIPGDYATFKVLVNSKNLVELDLRIGDGLGLFSDYTLINTDSKKIIKYRISKGVLSPPSITVQNPPRLIEFDIDIQATPEEGGVVTIRGIKSNDISVIIFEEPLVSAVEPFYDFPDINYPDMRDVSIDDIFSRITFTIENIGEYSLAL